MVEKTHDSRNSGVVYASSSDVLAHMMIARSIINLACAHKLYPTVPILSDLGSWAERAFVLYHIWRVGCVATRTIGRSAIVLMAGFSKLDDPADVLSLGSDAIVLTTAATAILCSRYTAEEFDYEHAGILYDDVVYNAAFLVVSYDFVRRYASCFQLVQRVIAAQNYQAPRLQRLLRMLVGCATRRAQMIELSLGGYNTLFESNYDLPMLCKSLFIFPTLYALLTHFTFTVWQRAPVLFAVWVIEYTDAYWMLRCFYYNPARYMRNNMSGLSALSQAAENAKGRAKDGHRSSLETWIEQNALEWLCYGLSWLYFSIACPYFSVLWSCLTYGIALTGYCSDTGFCSQTVTITCIIANVAVLAYGSWVDRSTPDATGYGVPVVESPVSFEPTSWWSTLNWLGFGLACLLATVYVLYDVFCVIPLLFRRATGQPLYPFQSALCVPMLLTLVGGAPVARYASTSTGVFIRVFGLHTVGLVVAVVVWMVLRARFDETRVIRQFGLEGAADSGSCENPESHETIHEPSVDESTSAYVNALPITVEEDSNEKKKKKKKKEETEATRYQSLRSRKRINTRSRT